MWLLSVDIIYPSTVDCYFITQLAQIFIFKQNKVPKITFALEFVICDLCQEYKNKLILFHFYLISVVGWTCAISQLYLCFRLEQYLFISEFTFSLT